MKAFWPMRALLLFIIPLGLVLLAGMLPHGSMAQGQPLPTPTNIGKGGSGNGGGNDDEATPRPLGARVSGFVYNYSTGAYEGGVKVVISGGGWAAETASDSNGFYQVGDLGAGHALVNLRLPPGAHPVNADTALWLASGTDLRVDLGFYWGDAPLLPVQLSTELMENLLTVQLQNHTTEAATGGQIEVALPAGLLALPGIQASQGAVDYGEHKLRISAGDVPAGAKVMVTIPIAAQETPAYAQTDDPIQVSFTYDQQLTPQVMRLAPSQPAVGPPPAALAVGSAPQTTPAPPTPAPAQAQLKPLPTTGSSLKSSQTAAIWLPLLVVVGLGAAGWYAWRIKT